MPGPLPRKHEHERRCTPSTHPFILARRISKDDYDGQMIFGDLVGLKYPDICLKEEEKPRKTSPRKIDPTGDRTRARCNKTNWLSWNPEVHFRHYISPPLVPVLSKSYPISRITTHLPQIHFNINLPSTSRPP